MAFYVITLQNTYQVLARVGERAWLHTQPWDDATKAKTWAVKLPALTAKHLEASEHWVEVRLIPVKEEHND